METTKTVFRIFEVRAKAGSTELLRQKLSKTSVSVVSGKPGNLGYFFGRSLSSDEQELVFISVWKDLESIKAHFGKSWQESFLPEGYEALIESCSIKHVEFEGALGS